MQTTPTGIRLEEVDGGFARGLRIVEGMAPPGSSSGLMSDAGEEHHLVLEGTIRLRQGDFVTELGPGDYLVWDGCFPHQAENTGDTPARVLIITPGPSAVGGIATHRGNMRRRLLSAYTPLQPCAARTSERCHTPPRATKRSSSGKGGTMSSSPADGPRTGPRETGNQTRPRVLVTGANGLIGGFVMNAWRAPGSRFDPVGLARNAGPNADIVADIGDLDALVAACAGIDAIVHLAATSAVDSAWEAVLESNLIGTYNVFEAARRAGVPRVVFASSNHAIGTYELQAAPALYDLDDDRVYDHTAEIRPDSLYGVSKVYGEALGRHYVDQHGLSVVCLRIGGTRDPGHPSHPNQLWADMSDRRPETLALRRRMRAVWLSERDCVQLIEKSLLTEEPWVLVYGISNNPRRFWDIEHARRVLGYDPQDAAPEMIGDEDGSGTG